MSYLFCLSVVISDNAIESVAKTFGVDWPHLVAQIISFCILCAVLYRFAYRPILKMLEERRKQIAQGLADTEAIKVELARTEAQRHEVLLRANEEASKLIEEARTASTRLGEQELQKAMASAEQVLRQAHETAEQDYTRMLVELRKQVGGLVVETTAAVTRKVLTPEDQQRIAEDAARQLIA